MSWPVTLVDMTTTTADPAETAEPAATHRTSEELQAFLPQLLSAPRDVGTLELVVRRPGLGEREVLD